MKKGFIDGFIDGFFSGILTVLALSYILSLIGVF